jgi:hypothetical protein
VLLTTVATIRLQLADSENNFAQEVGRVCISFHIRTQAGCWTNIWLELAIDWLALRLR